MADNLYEEINDKMNEIAERLHSVDEEQDEEAIEEELQGIESDFFSFMNQQELELLNKDKKEEIMGKVTNDFPSYVGPFELFKIFYAPLAELLDVYANNDPPQGGSRRSKRKTKKSKKSKKSKTRKTKSRKSLRRKH